MGPGQVTLAELKSELSAMYHERKLERAEKKKRKGKYKRRKGSDSDSDSDSVMMTQEMKEDSWW